MTRPVDTRDRPTDLRARDTELRELMDDPDCDPLRLARTLDRFEVVNRLISGWGTVYRRELRPHLRGRRTRVVDLGCGGGDLVRRLAGLARRDGLDVEWVGADPDPGHPGQEAGRPVHVRPDQDPPRDVPCAPRHDDPR